MVRHLSHLILTIALYSWDWEKLRGWETLSTLSIVTGFVRRVARIWMSLLAHSLHSQLCRYLGMGHWAGGLSSICVSLPWGPVWIELGACTKHPLGSWAGQFRQSSSWTYPEAPEQGASPRAKQGEDEWVSQWAWRAQAPSPELPWLQAACGSASLRLQHGWCVGVLPSLPPQVLPGSGRGASQQP